MRPTLDTVVHEMMQDLAFDLTALQDQAFKIEEKEKEGLVTSLLHAFVTELLPIKEVSKKVKETLSETIRRWRVQRDIGLAIVNEEFRRDIEEAQRSMQTPTESEFSKAADAVEQQLIELKINKATARRMRSIVYKYGVRVFQK